MGLCRQIEIKDILKLSGLGRSLLRLDVPESILHPYSPIARALMSVLWPLARTKVLIHQVNSLPTSYLLFQQVNKYTSRVLMLASRYGPDEADRRDYAWQCLLEEATRHAGQAGILRLAAKVPDEAHAQALFARAGFRPIGREFLFGAPAVAVVPGAEPLPGRPAGGWDRNSLNKLLSGLYRNSGAEALWPVPFPSRWGRGSAQLFVWDTPSGPSVFVAVFGKGRNMLRIMYDTSERQLLAGSLAWIIARLARQRTRTIYVAVRETQEELGGVLEGMGFKHLLTQTFQTKDIARRVRAEGPVHRVPVRGLKPLTNMSRAAP